MNFLILGDGPDERDWADALRRTPEHRVVAAFPSPGLADHAEAEGEAESESETDAPPPAPADLDGALAVAGVEAVIVGGGFEFRAEALRRAAAEGFAIVVLHPPGPDSEAYYQVALSRDETGAVVVPDLPGRLHPGLGRVVDAFKSGALGTFRELRVEVAAPAPAGEPERDLARGVFPRWVDLVRALLGEIEAVTSTGDPPGLAPDLGLVVQLRASGGRRAEVRIAVEPERPVVLTLVGTGGSLTLELPDDLSGPSRLTRRAGGAESAEALPAWDPHAATLSVLDAARARRPARPNLLDATRATEVGEGVVRSLRRGRTVDLHYEVISEEATFKGVMTSLGCMVLLSILVVIPIALAGPALGVGWLIYIAYAIPPILLGFLSLQLLRFATRRPSADPDDATAGPAGSPLG